MRREVLHALRTIAFLAPAWGCVLVVPAIDPGPHCEIAGSSACATCIRTQCQPTVDACCNDSLCGGNYGMNVLGRVDTCGRGDQNGCAKAMSDFTLTKEEDDVQACVSSACHEACFSKGTDFVGTWKCSAPRNPSNTCAACIYSSCAGALDKCCGDSSCANDLSLQQDMGACASQSAPRCAYSATESTSGLAGVVRGCIAKECAGECMGDGRLPQSCNVYAAGAYCSCADAEKSSGPACVKPTSDASCVLGKGGCSCGVYGCKSSTGECKCDFRSEGSADCSVAASNSEVVCCIKLDETQPTCTCSRYTSKCYSEFDEYDIADCSEATVLATLKSARRVVTQCSQ